MWRVNEDVLVTDLGDELVLLHPAQGEMYSLNSSGRAVWLALPATPEVLGAHLESLGATPEQAKADVQGVLADLRERELVREG